jgi:flagellar basal-body rod protein FlgF
MDRLLYISMSGAKENMNALAVRANNLANANTVGFKADLEHARAMQAFGDGLPTRVFSMTENPSQNFDAGQIVHTGNPLDVAIMGDGWFTVQDAEGGEAYTRAGQFRLSVEGVLETFDGRPVMSDGDIVQVPVPLARIEITPDGRVLTQAMGAPANAMVEAAQLKMVNPPVAEMTKSPDGLFRRKDGQVAEADPTIVLAQGTIEGSNVNAVGEMTYMISLQRQFELQVKMMKTAEEMDRQHNQVLRIF